MQRFNPKVCHNEPETTFQNVSHTHKKSTKIKLHFFLAPGESSAFALGVGVEVVPLSPLNTINIALNLSESKK